jgi:two-component system, NarL family, sensor histidine kinase DesK
VRDDGRGSLGKRGEGSGLRGLAERVAEAGGTLDAGPIEEGGFRLVVRVPVGVQPDLSREATPPPVASRR